MGHEPKTGTFAIGPESEFLNGSRICSMQETQVWSHQFRQSDDCHGGGSVETSWLHCHLWR